MILEVNPEKYIDYESKNLAYKDQARNLIVKSLGYEPPLRISILSELTLRDALKRHDMGDNSISSLNDCIQFHTNFINRLMMERLESYNC